MDCPRTRIYSWPHSLRTYHSWTRGLSRNPNNYSRTHNFGALVPVPSAFGQLHLASRADATPSPTDTKTKATETEGGNTNERKKKTSSDALHAQLQKRCSDELFRFSAPNLLPLQCEPFWSCVAAKENFTLNTAKYRVSHFFITFRSLQMQFQRRLFGVVLSTDH